MIVWTMSTDVEAGQVTVKGSLDINGRTVEQSEVIAAAVLLYPSKAIAGAVERIEFQLQKDAAQ